MSENILKDLQDIELKKKILKDTELFVLDMDGTLYLGDEILDGALDFLESVKRAGKKYIFFTMIDFFIVIWYNIM